MQANDNQVGGGHYASEYQHWDFVQDCLCGLYLEGQITKYIYRWRKKNGIQDLEKALHFMQKLYETDCIGVLLIRELNVNEELERFISVNEVGDFEAKVIRLITNWQRKSDIDFAMALLRRLIDREKALQSV